MPDSDPKEVTLNTLHEDLQDGFAAWRMACAPSSMDCERSRRTSGPSLLVSTPSIKGRGDGTSTS